LIGSTEDIAKNTTENALGNENRKTNINIQQITSNIFPEYPTISYSHILTISFFHQFPHHLSNLGVGSTSDRLGM
jgi:hypothetical protein